MTDRSSSDVFKWFKFFSYSKEYFVGGCATATAGLFTNPLDLVKTRFQLQGELKAKGAYEVKYRNIFDAFIKISRHEGVRGLQKGLVSAIAYQLAMNSTRLGTYQTIMNSGITKNIKEEQEFWKLALAGAFSGCCGSLVANPFYLAKVQMQSAASPDIAVGYQHKHSGLIQALRTAYHSTGGLTQGLTSSMARVSVGSATQLATFTRAKQFFTAANLTESELGIVFMASVCSSLALTCTMTPFDVVATRMFNQKHGLYYNGLWDCISKMYKHEGLLGFYKGTLAHFFRIGPHSFLTLTIWDRYRKWFL